MSPINLSYINTNLFYISHYNNNSYKMRTWETWSTLRCCGNRVMPSSLCSSPPEAVRRSGIGVMRMIRLALSPHQPEQLSMLESLPWWGNQHTGERTRTLTGSILSRPRSRALSLPTLNIYIICKKRCERASPADPELQGLHGTG